MPKILKKIIWIAGLLVWCLLFGYGLLLLVLGQFQMQELKKAKSEYRAIEVEITEIEPTSGSSSHSKIVVLQPPAERHAPPDFPSKTMATTTNRSLERGDRLTMYYNPADPQERIVDFRTAEPMRRFGMIFTAAAALILLCVVLRQVILRRRTKPTAMKQ